MWAIQASISAALGMNEASNLRDYKNNSFAVIGDGAMTAGIAFEAMMHAGHLNRNLKIILNDNDMSIKECRRFIKLSSECLRIKNV